MLLEACPHGSLLFALLCKICAKDCGQAVEGVGQDQVKLLLANTAVTATGGRARLKVVRQMIG